MSLVLLALLGCAAEPFRSSAPDCEDVALEPGEVRVCRLGAGDIPDGVGGRLTDWRLQSALLDVIVRAEYAPLTRLSGPGGTVVAAIPTGGADPVLELVPTLPDGWFSVVEITGVQEEGAAALVLSGVDGAGAERTLTYRLAADSSELVLEGAEGFTLVPLVGAERVGGTVEQGDVVVGAAGAVVDHGGEVQWIEADRVVIAERRAAYQGLWPDGVAVSGTAIGATWVEGQVDGQTSGRLPVDADGAFSGELSSDTTAVVALAPGFAGGTGLPPGQGLSLELGEEGSLLVRAVDQDGADIPAVLERAGRTWAVPAGGTKLAVGPGVADTWLWAGPGHEAILAEQLAVSGQIELAGVLRRVGQAEDVVLAELGIETWPDGNVRQPAAERLAEAMGRGVGYAVLVADDEVAQDSDVDAHVADRVAIRSGTRASTFGYGQPMAWPWSADLEKAAHGAAPWHRLSAPDLLAIMRRGGERDTVVDLDWLAAAVEAGDDSDLDGATALRLDDLDGLATWMALLDQGRDIPVVGPWTWVEGVDPAAFSAVDVEAELNARRTVASTGPRIILRVDGEGPGGLRAADTGDSLGEVVVDLRVEAPAWAPVDQVDVYGSGGERIASFDTRSGPLALDIRFDLITSGWLVAVAHGAEPSPLTGRQPWAVSSAVWVE